MTAYFIIEEVDPYALSGLADQLFLEFAAQVVILDDEKLYQDVFFRLINPLKNGSKGLPAIYEQL